jgi:hypothetical protein
MFAKCFESLDIIGTKFHFYIGKTQEKKTSIGGILSILIFIFSILFIQIFGHNFFTRKNPTVTTSILNDLKYEFFDIQAEKIFFAFRIEDYDGNFINASDYLYFKIYYYKTEQNENGEYRKKISDEYLSYHICNESDYKDIDLSKKFGTLFCPELGGKKFGGYWDSPNLYYFEIQVYFCKNGEKISKNSNCTSLDNLRNFLNPDNPKFFAFYYPLIEFNPLSYHSPIQKRYKNYYYCLSHRLQRNDDVFLKKTIMNDDKGWIFNNYKNFSDWGVDSFKSTYSYYSENDLMNDGSSSKIYEINLYTSMEKNLYTRYYLKVQNVIAICGSLINFIFFLFETISHIIGESMLKLEIIKSNFYMEDVKKNNMTTFKRINTYEFHSTKMGDIGEINKIENIHKNINKNNVHSSLFSLTINENDENCIEKKIKFKNFNNHKSLNNKTLNLKIDLKKKSKFEKKFDFNQQLLLKRQKSQPLIIKKENKILDSFYEKRENLKMYFLVCCNNKKFYSKYFNQKNASILHWYFIYLMQFNRYLELMKQFEIIKKLLLNEYQIKSLLLLKKLDLKDEKERDRLMSLRYGDNENYVIHYFKKVFKQGNIDKYDFFIYQNLNEEVQKNIL